MSRLGEGSRGRSWPTGWGCAALLAGLLAAGFPGVLFRGQTFFYRDFGVLGYPFVHYFRESFWRGELPLWNPLSNCGAPFLAQWGTMVLYPFSLIYLLFPLPWSLNFFCLAHLFWGGMGAYFLARRWTGHALAATLAAVAFVFNGVTLSSLMWPNYTVALGWMPWVILTVSTAWRKGGARVPLAAAAGAMQLLAGVPEIVVLTWLLLGGFWALELMRGQRPRVKVSLRFGLVMALLAGLSAAQLLPFLELLAQSHREPGFAAEKWPMPIWGWANLLAPMFHYGQTPQGTFFQSGQHFLTSYYPGVVVVWLGLIAICKGRRERVWLLAGAALAGLILAMGEKGLIFGWLKAAIPSLGIARYPIKFVYLSLPALVLLAAFGARSLLAMPDRAPFKSSWRTPMAFAAGLILLMGVVVALAFAAPGVYDQPKLTARNALWRAVFLSATAACLWLAWRSPTPRAGQLLALGACGLIAWDGLTHLPKLNPTLPGWVFTPGLVQEKLQWQNPPRHGRSRAMISPVAEQHLLHSSVPDFQDELIGRRLALWSNLNVLEAVPKVNGSSTLQVREQAKIQSLLYATPETEMPWLADFLGVSHATAPGSVIDWIERDRFMPFVTIGQAPAFASPDEILARLTQPEFNPRETVFLPAEAKSTIQATRDPQAKVISTQVKAHSIEMEIECEQASIIVVAQTWYSAWTATVGNQPVPIWRANYAFQAIEVPPGRQAVRLVYRDSRFRAGLWLSGLTAVGCLAWWWRCRKPARSQRV